MCGCSSSVGSSSFNINKKKTYSNLSGCRTLRKYMIEIKKKSYSRYKLENSLDDLEVYNKIRNDLNNLDYCPEKEIVELYREEYGV